MTTKSGKAAANKMIETSSESALKCRTLGHIFAERTSVVERSGHEYLWSMSCSRCTVRRTKVLDSRGRILRTSYAYPKGYSTPGIGRLNAVGLGHLRLYVVMNVLTGM